MHESVGVMVGKGRRSCPRESEGAARPGGWGAEGPGERAPPRALEAAGLGERGRVCGAQGPPPRAHSQASGPLAVGRGVGGLVPRGGPGVDRGRAWGRGRRPEPGVQGRAEVGRTDAERKGSCIPRAAAPEASWDNGRRRPCPELTYPFAPSLTMGMGQKESPHCGKVRGIGLGPGSKVGGGVRIQDAPFLFSPPAFCGGDPGGSLKAYLRLRSRVKLDPPPPDQKKKKFR